MLENTIVVKAVRKEGDKFIKEENGFVSHETANRFVHTFLNTYSDQNISIIKQEVASGC